MGRFLKVSTFPCLWTVLICHQGLAEYVPQGPGLNTSLNEMFVLLSSVWYWSTVSNRLFLEKFIVVEIVRTLLYILAFKG
jgi:hypothetical protein